jgi:hypothetical protein
MKISGVRGWGRDYLDVRKIAAMMKVKSRSLQPPSVAALCWPKCELVTQLIFSFKTISCNLLEFSMKKMLKIQSLSHLRSNFFQITFSLNPTH